MWCEGRVVVQGEGGGEGKVRGHENPEETGLILSEDCSNAMADLEPHTDACLEPTAHSTHTNPSTHTHTTHTHHIPTVSGAVGNMCLQWRVCSKMWRLSVSPE